MYEGRPHLWFMPAYPLLLAGIYRGAGESHGVVFVVQALLVAVSAVAIHAASRRLFGPRAAAAAFLLVAVLPAWFVYPSTLTAETLVLVLGSVLLWIVARRSPADTRGRFLWSGAVGVVVGMLSLVKPEFVVWALAPVIVAIGQRLPLRHTAAIASVVVGVVAVSLAPWVVRNALVIGRFMPFSIAGGATFWLSAHNPALADYGEPPFRAALVRCGADADDANRAHLSGDPKAVDACLWRDGLRMIAAHPGYWVQSALWRVGHTLVGSHTTYLPGYEMSFAHARLTGQTRVTVVKTAFLALNVGFVALGAAGLVWLARTPWGALFLYLVLSKLAVHAVVFGTPRYGLHLTPVLAVAGGVLVGRVFERRSYTGRLGGR